MAREKKVLSLSDEAQEKLDKVKIDYKEAEDLRGKLDDKLKEVKADMMKKWCDEIDRLFKNAEDDMNFSECLQKLGNLTLKQVRDIRPGEVIYSENGTPLRLR